VRNRKLPLPTTVGITINMVRPGKRFGYQAVVDRYFSELGLIDSATGPFTPPTAGAFARSRQKIPLELFQGLYDQAVEQVTAQAAEFDETRWNGFRVYAIDGTKKNLPHSSELAEHFGVPEGAHFPQALVCALYDVLAKIPSDVIWGPYRASERALAKELYADLGPEDLLLMDRGFPSFEILDDLSAKMVNFLVRLPKTGMFREVGEFLANGGVDGVVTIAPCAKLVRERLDAGQAAPTALCLRVVKVTVPGSTAEPAVFITTLHDAERFPPRVLSDLYHLRWEEEEFYKLIKELLAAENIRGKSCLLVHQELIAMYLYCVLARMLTFEAAARHGIEPSQIPQQHAFLAASRYLDRLFTAQGPEDCERLLTRCVDEIAWRRYQKRPGRSHPRRSRSSFGKWGRKSAAA
jgi:hypothetical protein